MFSSVRGRITLVATAVVALALLGASLLVLELVENDLVDATERALEAELELDAQFFEIAGQPEFFEFETEGQIYGLGLFVEDGGFAFGSIFDVESAEPVAEVVIDVDRGVVDEIYDPFTGESIRDPETAAAIGELNFDFLDLDGEEGNQLLVGAVARDEVNASLDAVREALLVIGPVFTVLMGALIWWLVGRALRPVQAMSDQVQAITTSRLDQRVPVPSGNDEISGLANVMNGMLSRLQRGATRQRQFAADASHELRSPLSTVRAAAEIIERNPTSPRAPTLASDIVAEADRMDSLIGDLLDLARVDEETAGQHHVAVDLSALATGLIVDQQDITPDIVVTGDEAQLERAVDNLVSNARRHATSQVAISLRSVHHDGVHYAELCIEDDGQGVPTDLRATIFERFSRLDEARSRDSGGVGLGLALVQAIATRHRGHVAVDDSPVLGGARFTLHLPV